MGEDKLPGSQAVIGKEGDRRIVEPVEAPSLLAVLAALQPMEEEFPDVDADLPPLEDVGL